MKKRVIYGESNYANLLKKNGYFVDKTAYIAQLELVENPVFLRPRRFGKSMFCSLLHLYYDISQANRFAELFGKTWIGQNPTAAHNQYLVLFLNFSVIEVEDSVAKIESNFRRHCNSRLDLLRTEYASLLAGMPDMKLDAPVSQNLDHLLSYVRANQLPPVYVIIDEYDNFANQLITSNQDLLYRELVASDGFFKTFFKTLKAGRERGAIANIFITGVLPITIDELASAFNIASFLTLVPAFEGMLGFTQQEVDDLLDTIYQDYAFDPTTRAEVGTVIKNNYNGYHFVDPQGESLYNSTILIFFLSYFTQYRTYPKRLIDPNLKVDISWARRVTGSNPQLTEAFVDQLTVHNQILYDDVFLLESFDMSQFFQPGFFPISFFYLGLLTKQDDFHLCLPNLTVRQMFVEYFNQIHRIDVSTQIGGMMQDFINNPNLELLFAGYWRQYISQLPEVIFQQVNENFYRTTFFELCSRYLARWFTWNVERSYPKGKSDLEFVGKYHERFASMRWVIEFKYYSNHKVQADKLKIDQFTLKEDDTEQIRGYAEGLQQEYPEAQVKLFVIYCFGNLGFRVFAL
ncbi:MAG: AAA family ATPase [Caldilineaceae bacterium]